MQWQNVCGRSARAGGPLFVVVGLPGELTGSGTTCPTRTPHDRVHGRALYGIHPRVVWVPGSGGPRLLRRHRTRRSARAGRLTHFHGHLSEQPRPAGGARQTPARRVNGQDRRGIVTSVTPVTQADSTSGPSTGCTSRSRG